MVKKYLWLFLVALLYGPQTSMWTKAKISSAVFSLIGNEAYETWQGASDTNLLIRVRNVCDTIYMFHFANRSMTKPMVPQIEQWNICSIIYSIYYSIMSTLNPIDLPLWSRGKENEPPDSQGWHWCGEHGGTRWSDFGGGGERMCEGTHFKVRLLVFNGVKGVTHNIDAWHNT